MKDSDPAFPYDVMATDSCGVERVQASYPGMFLRDYFAAKVMQGLVACGPHDCEPAGLAHDAYLHADAMLAEREK